MFKFERDRFIFTFLVNPKSQFKKNKLIAHSAIYNMRMRSPRAICKRVTCCICPISDTANKSVNRGFRNVTVKRQFIDTRD